MRVLAVSLFVLSVIIQDIVWRGAARFRLYQGESRIRRSRDLRHLQARHYRPEAKRWLFWLRVSTIAMTAAFPLAFWAVLG